MLPTFLGIAAPKAGSTWLHDLLAQHPDIYVPTRRKELRFFDLDENYKRGLPWYEEFFPTDDHANDYRAIGEITPTYMFYDYAPQRIAQLGTIEKLIVIIRDPVDRMFSHYRWNTQTQNICGSLYSFVTHPGIVRYGMYAKHLKRVLEYFRLEQILVLIYEEVFSDVESTKKRLAKFLDVDASRFPEAAGYRVANKGAIPKFRGLYRMAGRTASVMRKRGLDGPVNLAKQLGIQRLFGKGKIPEQMTEDIRTMLVSNYESDIQELELLLGREITCWHK